MSEIIIFESEKEVKRLRLADDGEGYDLYDFVDYEVVKPYSELSVVALVFRHFGSLSGVKFYAISVTPAGWSLSFNEETYQGQLRLRECGRILELRTAHPGSECNGCYHRYTASLFALDEQTGSYRLRSGTLDIGKFAPGEFDRVPITVLE